MLMSTCARRLHRAADVRVWELPFMNVLASCPRLALAFVLYVCILFLVGGSLMLSLKVVNMGAAACRRRESAVCRAPTRRQRKRQRQSQRAAAPPAPPPVPPPTPPSASLPPAPPPAPLQEPLQSSPLVDVLICADLGQLVFEQLDVRDLSACDATCTALAASADARWRELIGKRWPKTIVWAPQVVEGMGHRNFFLWRARNREQHILEAFGFALQGYTAGLRQMLKAGKCVNGNATQLLRREFHDNDGINHYLGAHSRDEFVPCRLLGQTVLHAAVRSRALAAVKLLLEADEVDLSARTTYGNTPLHAAAQCGESEMCRLLVENGANHEMRWVLAGRGRVRCRLAGCLHREMVPYGTNGGRIQIETNRCGGMPVDDACGEARGYLESLSYSRRSTPEDTAPIYTALAVGDLAYGTSSSTEQMMLLVNAYY